MGVVADVPAHEDATVARVRFPYPWRVLATGLLGYGLSALGTALAARRYHWSLAHAFQRWDSVHYLTIAEHGYHATRLPSHGPVPRSDLAFFPGYPLAIRALHVVGLPWTWAGWLINAGCGLAALFVIAAVVRHSYGEPVASRTAQAVALFPGAAVLVFVYSEGLFLLLAAACLLAVTRSSWLLAGLAAAAAGFVRPSGVYLLPLLAVAAVVAMVARREWRALLAPALAPWGFLAYQLWLWRRTHRPDAWFAVERWGWHQRDDFMAEAWRLLTGPRPFSWYEVTLIVAGAGYLALVLLLAGVSRRGLPPLLWGYVAVMVLPLLLSSKLGPRPRFLLPVFPLMVLPARALVPRWAFVGYCAASAVGLVTAAYWFAGSVPA